MSRHCISSTEVVENIPFVQISFGALDLLTISIRTIPAGLMIVIWIGFSLYVIYLFWGLCVVILPISLWFLGFLVEVKILVPQNEWKNNGNIFGAFPSFQASQITTVAARSHHTLTQNQCETGSYELDDELFPKFFRFELSYNIFSNHRITAVQLQTCAPQGSRWLNDR